MQVNPAATGHQATKTCKAMHTARLQQKAVSNSAAAMDTSLYAYGEKLETREVFKCHRCLIAYDDDTQEEHGDFDV